jgi:hypothetical protein
MAPILQGAPALASAFDKKAPIDGYFLRLLPTVLGIDLGIVVLPHG